MAQKKNEILEEQRKSRKELLELKKMQQSGMPEKEATPEKTLTKKERILNRLYYDKWKIIAAIVIVACVVGFIVQTATKTKNDFGVIIYTNTLVSEQTADAIKDYLESNCEDINGDGKVKVAVINCSINADSDNYQYNSTVITRLQTALTDSDKLIIINDAETYEEFNTETATKGMLEGEALPIGEAFKSAQTNELVYTDGLLVSCRKVKDTALEGKKNIDNIYKESKKAVKLLTE